MTTKNEDAVRVLLCAWNHCTEPCDYHRKQAADISALTQHAEAGAVAWPLRARVWNRQSTQEWVLEIEGTIDNTAGIWRHPQPLTIARDEVPGLPTLYPSAQPASQQGEKNRPIDELLSEYEMQAWSVADAIPVAQRYVSTMPDSQVRCLLHILAHPTGDRVREKELRLEFTDESIDKLQNGMIQHGYAVPVRIISDAFRAAALDQEKGR